VQSATDYSFYNYRVTLVFWAVVGIGAALARKAESVESAEQIEAPKPEGE
jgi:hypothetical protein